MMTESGAGATAKLIKGLPGMHLILSAEKSQARWHTCNSRTSEAEKGGSEILGHPRLHSKSKASMGDRGRSLTLIAPPKNGGRDFSNLFPNVKCSGPIL